MRTISLVMLMLLGPAQHQDRRTPDFINQIATADRMDKIILFIALYREDHKHDPDNLIILAREYKLSPDAILDAWGHNLYYYSTGTHYVLASFGRSGIPRPPSAAAGATSTQVDFDTNMVMIDGDWAQSPANVDR